MSVAALRQALKQEGLCIGERSVLRRLKAGSVKEVLLATDCKESLRERLAYYQKIFPFQVTDLNMKGTEVGTLCKKQFSVAVLCY